MGRLLLTLCVLGGCTCSVDPAPARSHAPSEPEPPGATWIEALVALEPGPAATRVTVRPGRIDVSNADLIASWPASAVARAEASPEPAYPSWPRLAIELDDPTPSDRTLASLLEALAAARRAERASTGAGSGAGVYDLRVAAAVPFGDFERVLYTGSRAGYGAPRILLGEDGALARFDWPHAPSGEAPTEDEIRAALEAVARSEEPSLPAPEARWTHVRLESRRAVMTPSCDGLDDPAAVARCVRGHDVSLSVERAAPLGDVMPWVQHLSSTCASLRVVSR